jgi:hypothetical protein
MHRGRVLERFPELHKAATLARALPRPHLTTIFIIRKQDVIALFDTDGLIDEVFHTGLCK